MTKVETYPVAWTFKCVRCCLGPMPDSMSNCAEPMTPADTITSLRTFTVCGTLPLREKTTPTARVSSNTTYNGCHKWSALVFTTTSTSVLSRLYRQCATSRLSSTSCVLSHANTSTSWCTQLCQHIICNYSKWLSEQCLMSHWRYNRSFRKHVFLGNRLHLYWQQSREKRQNNNSNTKVHRTQTNRT